MVSSFLAPGEGKLGFPKSSQMIVCVGELYLLCLSYICFKWASKVIIGKCEIKVLIILWWRNIAIIGSMLVTSSDSLRSERVIWSLWISKRSGQHHISTVFCWLVIDWMFSGNTSGRTKFIFSVASELHKEGEQADSEVMGTLWLP